MNKDKNMISIWLWIALACAASMAEAQAASPSPAPSPAPSPSPSPANIEDRVAASESTLVRLLRTSVSGYVQARATDQETIVPETVVPESNFFVRRARLNLRHSFDRGRVAVSFDGGQNTVTVKDAYLDLFLTKAHGQRGGLAFRAGQFFRPFGFEVERASTDREFPERPTGWGVFFPGNRDQGFDLSLGLTSALTVNVAAVNGGGTSTATLSFRDGDNHKDVMARVRYALFSPRIDLAASVYSGQQTVAGAAAVPAQLAFVDSNGNGVKDPGEPTVLVSAARPAGADIVGDRNRWGFAANVYDLLGGTLRAEYVGAREITLNQSGSGPARGTAPARAWYASYVRNLLQQLSAGARYDQYDPDTDDTLRPKGDGEQSTLGVVLLYQLGDPIRLSATWERPSITVYDRRTAVATTTHHDLWTFQVQYRF